LADAAVLPVPRVTIERVSAGTRALPASVMLAAAIAPFEFAFPGSILGFTLTSSELALLFTLALAAVAWLRAPDSMSARTPIALPLAALVACGFAAALAAPEFRADALRVSARLCAALLLFIAVTNVAASTVVAGRVIASLVAAGALVGVIAVLELAQLPWVLELLTVFRPGFHVVGGQLRATSTLFYPTITSMFLEIAFALGLAWIAGSRWALAGLVLIAAGAVATFTRAGLITMTMSLTIVGGVVYLRSGQWGKVHTRLALLAAAIVVLVLASRSPQMLVARMSAEGSQEWYGAAYTVPSSVTFAPDSFNEVPVTLTNDGRLTWQSSATPPFALSYHWLSSANEDVVVFDGLRTPFADPIAPGETVSMRARVRAPGFPGTYTLIWDIVQEQRTWLSLEGVCPGRTIASIEGAPVGPPLTSKGRMPGGAMRMPRAVLWRTALDIAAERPMLGIGPDNFRHVYGRHLGLAAWDPRVHANSTYLEVLSGMGVLGAGALVWLMIAVARSMPAIVRQAGEARLPIAAASLAACSAIAAHALVDSFLTFTPTYVAFAIAAGLLFAHSEGDRQCA
jgi:hypothetical protein